MGVKKYCLSITIALALGACTFPATSRPSLTPTVTVSPSVSLFTPQGPERTVTTTSVIKMVPDKYRGYIGILYPPLPLGLSEGFGMVINPTNSSEWSLAVVRDDEASMLWFSKLAYRDLRGEARWRVSDILVLPILMENEVLIPSGCKVGNVLDAEILVIALLDQDAYINRYVVNTKVKMAWRANRTTGAFEYMRTTSVECFTDNAISLTWTTPTTKTTP